MSAVISIPCVQPVQRALDHDPEFIAVIADALAATVVDYGACAAFCDGFE
jgi:hypothetical protein